MKVSIDDLSPITTISKGKGQGQGQGQGQGEPPDQDGPEGDQPEGDQPEGDQPEGDQPGKEKPGKSKPGQGKPGGGAGDDEEGEWLDDKEKEKGTGGKAEENREKEIENKLSKRGDKTVDDVAKQDTGKKVPSGPPQGAGQTITKSEEEIKPAFNWKSLISQMVSKAKPPETTYTRPASRAATQVSIAQQTGAAAIKPGERPGEEIYKLAFVFDTSGSMYGAIGPALAETRNLLKMQKASTEATLGICFFASRYLLIEANLMNNTAWRVNSFKNMGRPVAANQKKSLDDVLRSSDSGGTYFGPELASELSSIASQGFNIIVFSDGDMLDTNNWNNFLSLWGSHKRQVFFIAPDLRTYQAIIKKLGVKPNNFGHM